MRRLTRLLVLLVPWTLLGCGTTAPPPELTRARTAIEHARLAPGATRAALEITEAEQALAMAEAAYDVEPSAETTVHLAYVAWRKAQRAASLARTRLARAEADDMEARAAALAARVGETPGDLPGLTGPLAGRAPDLEEPEVQAEMAPSALVHQLRSIGMTVVGSDGIHLRMDGESPMFDVGSSNLAPWAKARLDQFVTVVKDYDDHYVVVEGYSDASGLSPENRALSEARAEAARQYIIDQGIDADRIVAVGRGEEAPVAPNATAEGRGLNRRVELRLQLTL